MDPMSVSAIVFAEIFRRRRDERPTSSGHFESQQKGLFPFAESLKEFP
jgi:hypothetical protein